MGMTKFAVAAAFALVVAIGCEDDDANNDTARATGAGGLVQSQCATTPSTGSGGTFASGDDGHGRQRSDRDLDHRRRRHDRRNRRRHAGHGQQRVGAVRLQRRRRQRRHRETSGHRRTGGTGGTNPGKGTPGY